jgi:hypothetical protein
MAVDLVKNRNASRDVFGIHPKDLSTNVGAKNLSPILVIQTDEGLEIASQTIRNIEKDGVR